LILTLAALLELSQRCAPSVAPETLASVAQVESGFDPYAVGVNGAPHRVMHLASAAEAARVADSLVRSGADVDLGLGQINSRNLRPLQLSIAEAFDPCRNLAASGRLLSDNYRRALAREGDAQTALRAALSLYNTGDPGRGFRNGYVARVVSSAASLGPAFGSASQAARARDSAVELTGSLSAPSPALDVFERPPAAGVVIF
jgi:type IV secretion system protein VirB1